MNNLIYSVYIFLHYYYQGGRNCKHIKKVLLKGYNVEEDSATLYAKALSSRQLQKMGIDLVKCEENISEETLLSLLARSV